MLSTLELNRRNEFNLHFDMKVKNNKMLFDWAIHDIQYNK